MDGFAQRLSLAETLETTFIRSFNTNCGNYRIIKYGIESTKLSEAHEHIRFCRDSTSRFVRYIPDSVIVRTDKAASVGGNCDTTLIEFKAAKTGVREDSFLKHLQNQCKDLNPPLTRKEDILSST